MYFKFSKASPDNIEQFYFRLKDALLFHCPQRSDNEDELMRIYHRIKGNISDYGIAKIGDRVAAFYYFHDDGDCMRLDDLYVYEAYRFRGIGTSILRRCMQDTEKPIVADLYSRDVLSLSLFRHHAFTVQHRTEFIVTMLNENQLPYIPHLHYNDIFLNPQK